LFDKSGVNDIQLTMAHQPYDASKCLGIRSLKMTPNKQYLMVGHCDQKLRMLNTLSWKEVFAFDHSLSEINDNNSSTELNIYVESETPDEGPLYEAVGKPFKLERLTSPEMQQI
jgi:hypothetical protein